LLAYFGTDAAQYADRSPITHVAHNKVPVLLTIAEFDPGLLAAPTYLLAEAITRRDGKAPEVVWLKGHNHVSTVLSFGTNPGVLTVVADSGAAEHFVLRGLILELSLDANHERLEIAGILHFD
jgi:hypothetical protein